MLRRNPNRNLANYIEKKKDIREFFSYYVKGAIFYVVVIGALAKFSFDNNSNVNLRNLLGYFSILISILFSLVCVFSIDYQKKLIDELSDTLNKNMIKVLKSDLYPYKALTIILAIFIIMVIIGWILLLTNYKII